MLRRPRTWLILLVVWWVTLFILSHQSNLFPPGPDIENIDKVEHAGLLHAGRRAVLLLPALLAARAWASSPPPG